MFARLTSLAGLAAVLAAALVTMPIYAQDDSALAPTSRVIFSTITPTPNAKDARQAEALEQLQQLRVKQLSQNNYLQQLQQRSFTATPGIPDSWAHGALVSVRDTVQFAGSIVATALTEDAQEASRLAFDKIGGFVVSVPMQLDQLSKLVAHADGTGKAIFIGHAIIYAVTPMIVGNVVTRAVKGTPTRVAMTFERGGRIEQATFLDDAGITTGRPTVIQIDPLAAELDHVLNHPTEFPSPVSGMHRRSTPSPSRPFASGGTTTLEAPVATQLSTHSVILPTAAPTTSALLQTPMATLTSVLETPLPAPKSVVLVPPPIPAPQARADEDLNNNQQRYLANVSPSDRPFLSFASWSAAGCPINPEVIARLVAEARGTQKPTPALVTLQQFNEVAWELLRPLHDRGGLLFSNAAFRQLRAEMGSAPVKSRADFEKLVANVRSTIATVISQRTTPIAVTLDHVLVIAHPTAFPQEQLAEIARLTGQTSVNPAVFSQWPTDVVVGKDHPSYGASLSFVDASKALQAELAAKGITQTVPAANTVFSGEGADWHFTVSTSDLQPQFWVMHEFGHVLQIAHFAQQLETLQEFKALHRIVLPDSTTPLLSVLREIDNHIEMIAPIEGQDPAVGAMMQYQHIWALTHYYRDALYEIRATLPVLDEVLEIFVKGGHITPETAALAKGIFHALPIEELITAVESIRILESSMNLQKAPPLVALQINYNIPSAVPNVAPRAKTSTTPVMSPFKQPPPQRASKQVGRNDPCPCGSGKKYKKCHGANAMLTTFGESENDESVQPPALTSREEIERREFEDLCANLGEDFSGRFMNVESWRAAGWPRPEAIYNARTDTYSKPVATWTLENWLVSHPTPVLVILNRLYYLLHQIPQSNARLHAKVIDLHQLDPTFRPESYRVRIWQDGTEVLRFDVGSGFFKPNYTSYFSNLVVLDGEAAQGILSSLLPDSLNPNTAKMLISIATQGGTIVDFIHNPMGQAYTALVVPGETAIPSPAITQFIGYGENAKLTTNLVSLLRIFISTKNGSSSSLTQISRERMPSYRIDGRTYIGDYYSTGMAVGFDFSAAESPTIYFISEVILNIWSDADRQIMRLAARAFADPGVSEIDVQLREYDPHNDQIIQYRSLQFDQPWPEFGTLRPQ